MDTSARMCWGIFAFAETEMKSGFSGLVGSPVGAFAVLSVAALLEVLGDACFRSGLFGSAGAARVFWLLAGAMVLGSYGVLVNLPGWDFGRLLGVYVTLFFVMAQGVAWMRFDQRPTLPICVSGGLIVAGGVVITFWSR